MEITEGFAPVFHKQRNDRAQQALLTWIEPVPGRCLAVAIMPLLCRFSTWSYSATTVIGFGSFCPNDRHTREPSMR